MLYNISSLKETENLAIEIASKLKPGSTILLTGDLGAGKTTFTQFLGKHLGVSDIITSPTFNILKMYKANGCEFYHMDAYRLGESGDSGEFDDYLYDKNRVMVIEWPQYLSEKISGIEIDIKVNGSERVVNVKW